MPNQFMTSIPFRKSIRGKVILRISGLLSLAMFFITAVVAVLNYRQMSNQMEVLLQNNAYDTQQRLEERIAFLVDNARVLAKNEILVNSLLDEEGRRSQLPSLAKNFMEGKDVESLSIVDFDGTAIFQTRQNIPRYDTSADLRAALSMNEPSLYIEKQSGNMVVVMPIEYYATTQGALVIVLKTDAIASSVVPHDLPASLQLTEGKSTIFGRHAQGYNAYRHIVLDPTEKTPYLSELALQVDLGLLESVYIAPVIESLLPLGIISLFFILAGLIVSVMLAETVTRPIVELYRRVVTQNVGEYTLCAPLGSNDELEALARAFDERSLNLQHLSRYDVLTGLPNRLFFLDRLEHAIKRCEHNQTLLAVLFVDLDHFKEINDSLGHAVGDEVLQKVADLLTKIVRDSDTVSRFGGDEFAILIDEIRDERQVIDTIGEVMHRFKETMQIENFRFFVSTSVGVALYPQNGVSADILIKNADAAMHKAKDEGRNGYQFYSDTMTEQAYARMLLQNQLHDALGNNEFRVYYQPQVNIQDEEIVGMEALIRWNHPQNGIVSPNTFIPLAEETGLIVDIDRWVMRTAMQQLAEWSKAGYRTGKLSLNLSMLQLKHPDFLDAVRGSILESGIDTAHLQFEITETQIMKNPEEAIAMLHQLKTLGITLAIDDFGTGHSSLSYLKRLPIDKLKIDKSFVDGIPGGHDDIQLLLAIIAMAKNLNLELIAEGVETQEQAEYLAANGCSEAQGYFYYRPIDEVALTAEFERKGGR